MGRFILGSLVAGAVAIGASCGSPAASGNNFAGGGAGGGASGTGGATGGSAAGGGTGGSTSTGGGTGGGSSDAGPLPLSAFTGLPCDVATVLASRCVSCHGAPLTGGAPVRLETRDDLIAISSTYGVSYADRSVSRMTSTTSPMPPAGAPPASETAALQNWIAAGKPVSSCSQVIDAGTPDAGPAPVVCTSGSFWTLNDLASADMNPGLACKACHAARATFKNYTYMGTVFPSLHEQDKCNGALAASVTVEVFDSTGRVLQSATASTTSGNFHMGIPILQQVAPWYRARVKANGKVLEMQTPVTSGNGDCNSCHTEQGANGAPGRIVYPR